MFFVKQNYYYSIMLLLLYGVVFIPSPLISETQNTNVDVPDSFVLSPENMILNSYLDLIWVYLSKAKDEGDNLTEAKLFSSADRVILYTFHVWLYFRGPFAAKLSNQNNGEIVSWKLDNQIKSLSRQALPYATSKNPVRAEKFFIEYPSRPLSDVIPRGLIPYFDTEKVDAKVYHKTIAEFTNWLSEETAWEKEKKEKPSRRVQGTPEQP